MELQSIIQQLTKKHYEKTIRFHLFDQSDCKTETVIEKKVSDFFTKQEWESGIALLHQLQINGKSKFCFTDFWENFLVNVETNLGLQMKFVRVNSLNVEHYLKHIMVLLGHGEAIRNLEAKGGGMMDVINLAKKVNLLGDMTDASHILHTIRCYANWYRHDHQKEVGHNPKAMIIPNFSYDEDDFPLLYEQVRSIIVILLFITRKWHREIESKLPRTAKEIENDIFDGSSFLDLYFSNLEKHIEKELKTQAIEELQAENNFGYFEPTLRFSHSTDICREESDDEENDTQQRVKLGQFRKNSTFKTNIILGMPGAGKTTALYLLIRECIRQYNKYRTEIIDNEDDSSSVPIPVVIPLRSISLSQDDDIIKGAINQEVGYRIIEKDVNYRKLAFKFIYDIIKEGRAILFFDGLNEIAHENIRKIVASLKNFIGSVPEDSRIFITGRKYEYDGSSDFNDLKTISNLGVWHLEELSFEQIENYLSPHLRSQIINGGIIELFSSPLNLRLFLNYINKRQTTEENTALEVPLNRGEILDAFLDEAFKDCKSSKNGQGINPFYANKLLKLMASTNRGRQWDTAMFKGKIEHMSDDLIYRLAAANILSISPASIDKDEQVSFSIDTFHEFFRAKHIIDRLLDNNTLSLYSLDTENINLLAPESPEDFETLKLIFEIGSSPLCYQRKKAGSVDVSIRNAAAFSQRLAKDFLNPPKRLSKSMLSKPLNIDSKFTPAINPRLLTLCRLTRNIPFAEDNDVEEKTSMNAKDIAELMVMNNLKWFRIKNPQPILISKKNKDQSAYLIDLITAAAIVGGSNIWNELISTYWMFTFGLLSPYDYNLIDKIGNDNKTPYDKVQSRINLSYPVLYNLACNCRDYIYLYDTIHNLHCYHIKRKNNNSSHGINSFLYRYFLCFLPDYAKKHLYYHISQKYSLNKTDTQLLSDINTVLCYSGDSQLIAENFEFKSEGRIRLKELRYILSNFSDTNIQKFVFRHIFFEKVQSDQLKAMIIRHYLFRLGLTPIMKDFLFKEGGLKHISQDDQEGIMDMIPLHSVSKEFINNQYDKDIYNLLIKENYEENPGCGINYVYFGKLGNNFLVSINDIEEDALTGESCHIGSDFFSIVSDNYKDTARLHCRIKADCEHAILLPETSFICNADKSCQIPYQAPSSNTTLDFYLYGDDAANIYELSKKEEKVYINDIKCVLDFPEMDMKQHLVYRPFRILEIQPELECISLPYNGEMVFEKSINKTARSRAAYDSPERYEYLSNNLDLKTVNPKYRVFGQNKSFLWVITEKVVNAVDQLIGCTAIDDVSREQYQVCSVKTFNTQYMEFWFKVSQRVSLPSYGTFSLLTDNGEYSHIPFCFSVKSDDGYNFRLRVSYENIPDFSISDMHKASYLLGNIPLQLVSVERINPNRRYSIWTLKKSSKICSLNSGSFHILMKDNPKACHTITISGETRTTVKHMSCQLASYDRATGEVTFIAKKPKGTIGHIKGEHHLLKGLFLCSTQASSVRLLIEKNSEMNPLWIKRMNIRFNRSPKDRSGYILVNGSKINFVSQENNYVLWCNCNSNISADEDLEALLKENKSLKILFNDDSTDELRIQEISLIENYKSGLMIIRSHCREEFSSILNNNEFAFNLQNFVPVLNQPVFPKTFKELYFTYSVRYNRDIKEAGTIIIPAPETTIEADSVILDGGLKWRVNDIKRFDDKYIQIGLSDLEGRKPKVKETGTVVFQKEEKDYHLCYRSLSRIINWNYPEKYHAEVCEKLLDEIMGGEHKLDLSTIDFFVRKSRAYELASNKTLLKEIDEISESRFDICRVLISDPLKGLEAYSTLNSKTIMSSDTMPENHDGREFQWMDLVLFEKNHKLTLVNDLPRYRCLGYKDGFIVSVSETPDNKGRMMARIITSDNKEESYFYFYNPMQDTRKFALGKHVNFFATVNYRNQEKPAAENVILKDGKQDVCKAKYTGYRKEFDRIIFSFASNGSCIEISLNERAYRRIDRYQSILVVGQSYKLIKGLKKYFLTDNTHE